MLDGLLGVPPKTRGLVLFAHGSGSSRLSPRNTYVARALRDAAIGTLLFDLLTPDEAEDRALVFDVDLLARRLCAATEWARGQPATQDLPVGTSGPARERLPRSWPRPMTPASPPWPRAAADPTSRVPVLPRVQAPTLLIVGGDDRPVIAMNESALRRLRCEKRLTIVSGATHLFEEPGTLDQVVRLATDWFGQHLRAKPRTSRAAAPRARR